MNACQKNRKELALLAMDALEAGRARELRAHVGVCPECRRYLDEIEGVAGALRAVEPEPSGQPSASFHRNVMAAITTSNRSSSWAWALPAAAAVVMSIAVWFVKTPSPDKSVPSPHAVAMATMNLEPTFSNYAWAANQSLDKLDELLKAQGEENSSPSRVYTNSWLPSLSVAD